MPQRVESTDRPPGGERIPLDVDVAFSFLAADEPVTRQIAQLIEDRVAPFVYSEQQKELAGTNGVATLTRIFRETATLSVVLYRAGYGSTKWTRIEESAITSRGLEQGWDTVFLISLDGTRPTWIPPAQFWYGVEQVGPRTAADVILAHHARVRESGRPESHLVHAGRVAQRLANTEEARQWRGTIEAFHAVQQELAWMRDYLTAEVDNLNDAMPTLHARFVTQDHWVFGVDAQGATVHFGWSQQYNNTLTNTLLNARERAAPDIRDKPIRLRYARPLQTVLERDYEPVLGEGGTVMWESVSERGKPCFTSKQLLGRHLKNLVEHSGEVLERPHQP